MISSLAFTLCNSCLMVTGGFTFYASCTTTGEFTLFASRLEFTLFNSCLMVTDGFTLCNSCLLTGEFTLMPVDG